MTNPNGAAAAPDNDERAAEGRLTIDDLLLSDTPERIRKIYLGLAEEARSRDFGLLEQDVVVLDTETTGLSFKKCQLIEIAAARLSGREVVGRYHTFVHPGGPIPPEIVKLTGITDLDVTDAPSPEEAVRGLAEFVGGDPVLAHNATFDRTFVEKVRGGVDVSDNWIDTLALSRIALPRLSSHRLSDMAEAFGCDTVSHRAMDDVDALCGMWRIMLCGLAALPAGLLGRLASMHDDVEWQYRPILNHLALDMPDVPLDMPSIRRDLMEATDDHPHVDPAEKDVELVGIPADEVAAEFGPDGIVGRMYDAYETRPEQLQMAQEVRRAQSTSTHRSIEAGTGVGKSIAYLLPSALYARRNNVTVGVATKTNALTDQLVSHELPALDRQLGGDLTYFSLKGYDHYPCLRKVVRATNVELPVAQSPDNNRSEQAIEQDMLTAIAVTLAFASQSPSGDLDALGIRWRSVPRGMLTTTADECQRRRCPFFPKYCLLHGARRRAACADVVVTNHSLLLRDVEADGNILPPIRHWVVDEAHSFEAEARKQWAVEASTANARAAFEELGGTRSGTIKILMAQSGTREASTTVVGLLTKASVASARAQVATADLFDRVRGLASLAGRSSSYDKVTLWLGPDVRATEAWGDVVAAADGACRALDETCRLLDQAAEAVKEAVPDPAAALGNPTRMLKGLLEGIRLVVAGEDESYVCSAQFSRGGRAGSEALIAEKVDVGAELAERWLPEMMSVVFTSATIAVGEDFSHFDNAVGLDRLPSSMHDDVRLDSSFDYDSNMRVLVVRDLPTPGTPGYVDDLAELLYDVHVAMDGSVLTLFTNRREMERVYEILRPRLAELGLDLAMQERGAGARQVRDRFLSEKSLSLLALKSFWEGFDAAGDTLRCVVVPRLPFGNPSEPISCERALRDRRAWWRYSLPEAVIATKQAAGRLIRTASDTGVLVMADSRLVEKRYGKQFVSSMPTDQAAYLERANVARYISAWRAGDKNR